MDRHDEAPRTLPAQDTSPALLALAPAPLDPSCGLRPRGPGWRLVLGLILLVGIGSLGALLATGGLQALRFTDSFEDY